jgi:hypothetical protein
VSNHTRCHRSFSDTRMIEDPPSLPTRCIQVLPASTPLGFEFQLRETRHLTGRYATLSHSEAQGNWHTQAGNYSLRLSGLDATRDGLPQLYLDVLVLAGNLGIEYVWIDTICVVQDSEPDCAAESLRRGHYYQNATFTVIAALDLAGVEGASVLSRPQKMPRLASLPYRDRSGVERGCFYAYGQTEHGDVGTQEWDCLSNGDFFSCAWMLQDWLLSRRIICFTPTGSFFHCRSSRSGTEMVGGGDITSLVQKPLDDRFRFKDLSLALREISSDAKVNVPEDVLRRLRLKLLLKGTTPLDLSSVKEIFSSWKTLAVLASGSCLVESRDKSAALVGVVAEFKDALTTFSNGHSPTFKGSSWIICGLWLENIHEGLLWEQVSGEGISEDVLPAPVQEHIHPTWSWLSSRGQIDWRPLGTTSSPGFRTSCKIIGLARPSSDKATPRNTPDFRFSTSLVDNQDATPFPAHLNFSILILRAKLAPVLIDRRLAAEDDRRVAAALTETTYGAWRDDARGRWGRPDWRTVVLPQDPERSVGYASMEHAEFQREEAVASPFLPGRRIYALLVAEAWPRGVPWVMRMPLSYKICHVLFVRCVEGGMWERLGVGRLVGRQVERLFADTEEQDVRVV